MKPVIIIAIAFVLLGISITSISAQSQTDIPDWVKNIFEWYAEDRISANELMNFIVYLINEGILVVN